MEMNNGMRLKVLMFGLLILSGLLMVQPALAHPPHPVESPPEGTSPNYFAVDYSGCLGSLRSAIARGEFEDIGPFEEHFNGQVNPGAHQGTVGEEEFLTALLDFLGLEVTVEQFCASF
jgi:hypothetical protein